MSIFLDVFPQIKNSSLIAAGGILATAIELIGFVNDRKSKVESKPGINANLTSNGPVGIRQKGVSVHGHQTVNTGTVQGDLLSGQSDGPDGATGRKSSGHAKFCMGPISDSSGQINQHIGDNITHIFNPQAKPPVPQIQEPTKDFVGRDDYLKEILSSFKSSTTIIGLRGMGGIGKGSLALVLAKSLKDRFPDGQIFLDMLGAGSREPLATAEAMALIIRAYLGAGVQLPNDLNGLNGLYHSVLSGKRALILLDNAASREQVEPLLPPVGSALLITSRNKFTLPGLKEWDLDVLPLEDAKKLLLEIAGRIGGHAEELAELCGCLPLALRNAASALAEKKNLNVADYVERLKDAREAARPGGSLLQPELRASHPGAAKAVVSALGLSC